MRLTSEWFFGLNLHGELSPLKPTKCNMKGDTIMPKIKAEYIRID